MDRKMNALRGRSRRAFCEVEEDCKVEGNMFLKNVVTEGIVSELEK